MSVLLVFAHRLGEGGLVIILALQRKQVEEVPTRNSGGVVPLCCHWGKGELARTLDSAQLLQSELCASRDPSLSNARLRARLVRMIIKIKWQS